MDPELLHGTWILCLLLHLTLMLQMSFFVMAFPSTGNWNQSILTTVSNYRPIFASLSWAKYLSMW